MVKFCQECGAKLIDDGIKYCTDCGNKIIRGNDEVINLPITNERKTENNAQMVIQKDNKQNVVASSIILFSLGIVAIFSIYTFPIIKIFGVSMSVADIHTYCSNTWINAISGDVCSQYDMFFYIGWVIGISLLFIGLIDIIRK